MYAALASRMSSADGSACCAGSAAAAGAVACSGAVTPGSADPASDCTAPGGAGFASTCAATGGVDFGIGAGPGGMSCGLASTAAAVGGGVAAGLADAGSCGLASTAAAVGGGGAAGLADAGAWAVAASDPVGSTGGGATLFGPAETGAGEGTYDGVGLDSIENSSVLFLRIADQKALAASAVTGAKVTLSSASATGGAFALAFGIGLVWKGWLLQARTGDGWIASGGGDASIGVGTALGDGSMITIGDTGWFGHGVSSCWLFSTGSVTTGWLSSTNIGSTLSTTGAIDMAAGLGSGWLVSTADCSWTWIRLAGLNHDHGLAGLNDRCHRHGSWTWIQLGGLYHRCHRHGGWTWPGAWLLADITGGFHGHGGLLAVLNQWRFHWHGDWLAVINH